MVALYHLGQRTVVVVPNGYPAVDFLFMLSGFAIALNYQDRMEQGFSFWRFAQARLVRIYLMFLLGLVIGVPVKILRTSMYGMVPFVITDVPNFTNLIILPSPFSFLLFSLNSAIWSLFVALLVSLLFGALMYRASDRTLLVIMLSAAAALIFVLVGPDDYIDMGWSWSGLVGDMARACFSFPLNMLMYRRLNCFRYREAHYAVAPFLILALVMIVSSAPGLGPLSDLLALFVVLPLALVFGIAVEPPRTVRYICVRLGDFFYPAYAILLPLVFATLYVTAGTRLHSFAVFSAFLIALCSVALLLTHHVDAPVRAWLNGRLRHRRASKKQTLSPAA